MVLGSGAERCESCESSCDMKRSCELASRGLANVWEEKSPAVQAVSYGGY